MKNILFFLLIMLLIFNSTAQNNVGIGTTNPLFKLHLLGNAGAGAGLNGGILIENNSASTGEAAIAFKNAGTLGTGSKFWCIGLNQNRNLSFSYASTFGQASTQFLIDSIGRVGVGTTSPSEKLDVVGNIKLSGEVNRPATGAANLVPICFGSVGFTGNIMSGTGNFTVFLSTPGLYVISIAGESYSNVSYTTIVTPIDVPYGNLRVPSVSAGAGDLIVEIYDHTGAFSGSSFHFVVYKR